MTNLVQSLNDEGLHVQLKHVPTETSWEDLKDHGYIAIFSGTKQLLRRDGFQHNRKLRSGGAYDATAVKSLTEEVVAALKEAEEKKVPTFIESEFTTKAEYESWLAENKAKQGAAAA